MLNDRLTYENFVDMLLETVPEFQPIYNEHMIDYEELLTHVLMGDFVRFLFDAYSKSVSATRTSERWKTVIIDSLDVMEEAIVAKDPKLRNLISVSFLENLSPDENNQMETYQSLKLLLGPNLRKELKYYDHRE